jgi:hypothetical protein
VPTKKQQTTRKNKKTQIKKLVKSEIYPIMFAI